MSFLVKYQLHNYKAITMDLKKGHHNYTEYLTNQIPFTAY